MFEPNAIGIFGLVAIAACWALAVVLFRNKSPGNTANMLAIVLVVEGITLFTAGYMDMNFTQEVFEASWYPHWAKIAFIIHTAGDCAMLAFYPPFLGVALNTKLTRPFAGKGMRIALAIVSVVIFIAVQVTPLEISLLLLYGMLTLLFAYALVGSVHAWLVAPAGIAKDRARIFVIGFGIRDILWGIIYLTAIWQVLSGAYEIVPETGSEIAIDWMSIVYATGTFVAIPMIAYGILRTQLFDIDLKIRWTIKQSTLAGIFVATMFVISEGAAQFLEAELGNIAGLLAAAVVMFFLAPLQRFSEKVAAAAMPNTENTPEYAAFKKMQVYESAIRDAQAEGGISSKERTLLDLLRDSLEISKSVAAEIEAELQGAMLDGSQAQAAA
jgi:hypothetical protein